MIISIAHQKGGVGKSTLAFNLAYYLSKYNPILVDLDIQSTISYANTIRANNKPRFNVKNVTSDEDLKTLARTNSSTNLFIIDTGGFDSSLNRLSIVVADLIITPVSDQPFELLGLKKFEEILQELSKIKKENIRSKVLLNNISPAVKNLNDLYQFINNSNNFETMQAIIRQRADIVHSSAKGLAVAEYKKGCKADLEYKALVKEIEKSIFN